MKKKETEKKENEREAWALGRPLKLYLYFTAAITGAAIMIVEILGAKMLAPYFGTSHFVWTAQIAVTLVALAAGYYAGGKLVERSSNLGGLYAAILAAAAYLAGGVLVLERLAYACFDARFSLPAGTLITASFLYFVPLSLLAMVGPFLIRVLTVSVAGVGANAGRLTAISTLGSFLGTILIGYLLIPRLPNSTTMLGTASLLILIAAIYFFIFGSKAPRAMTILAALAVSSAFWFDATRPHPAPPRMVEVHRRNSNFGLLQVLQSTNGDRRYYLNDYLTQNTYDPALKKSTSVFTYALHDLAVLYTAEIRHVLCIGLGIGIVPMTFAREGVEVDVVEINPAVIPLATRFFDLEPARLRIATNDGRAFLNQVSRRFDAIILDAFLGDSSPSHLLTREAFSAMNRVLNRGGTLVINCFADFAPGQDFFAASLDKTLKSVFPSVKIHDAGNGNVFFVASSRASLSPLHPVTLDHVHPSVRGIAEQTFRTVVGTIPEHGRILTDDYNPLEYYDAANRERIRRYLALNFRAEK